MKNIIVYIVLCFSLTSCKESKQDQITRLIREWEGKEIIFPDKSVFTIQGRDTVDFDFRNTDYKIVTYVDSTGCTGCKLQLLEWQDFMQEVDSLTARSISFIFYFHPKNRKELRHLLRLHAFVHPVCFDEKDEFNTLNHFPKKRELQTFLLDRENRVVAVGNPHYTRKIRNIYLKRITDSDK